MLGRIASEEQSGVFVAVIIEVVDRERCGVDEQCWPNFADCQDWCSGCIFVPCLCSSAQPPYQDPYQYQQPPQPPYQQDPYYTSPPPPPQAFSPPPAPIKKSLLIGINYTGSAHELRGCHRDVENVAEFLYYRGYSNDPSSQVILRDDLPGAFYPTGQNILSAITWLISTPGTTNFFHYSGHGGQVRDPTGLHPSGILDTICPVDFETSGQINSDMLHAHLVTAMPSNSTLFAILDCCHSGSGLGLPYIYHSDDEGNVSMIDNVKAGMRLLGQANELMRGGFSMAKMGEAKGIFAGATSLFHNFSSGGQQEEGIGEDANNSAYAQEQKMVTMFSGCRDDQTSADASIAGSNEGAMSWAFLQSMKKIPNPTFLQNTTQRKARGKSQVFTEWALISRVLVHTVRVKCLILELWNENPICEDPQIDKSVQATCLVTVDDSLCVDPVDENVKDSWAYVLQLQGLRLSFLE
ncbi:hypothetical protein G7Y89_g9093 [Cudoniella acicularis]|uniref:Peptidase C14 caspase domain-containing protein n=1 Tax=Cudoniella acicularis TaxID=354080 RepID=A0A8H4W285_9HELO|nr:hypothetical protein G7Y89_g9093 [Cudoniella acicularis]